MSEAHVKLLVYPDRAKKFWHRATRTVEVSSKENLAAILPELVSELTLEVRSQVLRGFKQPKWQIAPGAPPEVEIIEDLPA